mmetsp:Transcript_129301/g.258177  ORF Transcript_129301/g.258177 Transcript_129301/m.258177 type:complete len:290 (-) Transcript_129301:45-914(-)
MVACSNTEAMSTASLVEQPPQPKEEEQHQPPTTAAMADTAACENGQHAPTSTTPTDSAATHGAGEASAAPLLRLHIIDGTGSERRLDVHVERGVTVAQLKSRHFAEEVAQGWRLRCIFLGRLLSDGECASQLPNGSILQCYLQRPVGQNQADRDLLLPSWLQLAGRGRSLVELPGPKWQDLLFHSALALGLAVAWAAYLAEPQAFDTFGRFALHFFSLAWVFVCISDLLRPPGNAASRSNANADTTNQGAAQVAAAVGAAASATAMAPEPTAAAATPTVATDASAASGD